MCGWSAFSVLYTDVLRQLLFFYCNSPVQALSINAPAPSLGLVLHGNGYVIHPDLEKDVKCPQSENWPLQNVLKIAWFATNDDQKYAFLIWVRQSSIFNPRSSILDPQSLILNPQSSILDPQSSILNPPSSIFNPQYSILNPLPSIHQPQPPLLIINPLSLILNPQCSTLNPQSSIIIFHPQSSLINP